MLQPRCAGGHCRSPGAFAGGTIGRSTRFALRRKSWPRSNTSARRRSRSPTRRAAADGTPVILLHGFPYDPRAYDGMLPLLAGCRDDRAVSARLRADAVPLRRDTMRSGEQAALGNDLKEMMDALDDRARGSVRLRLGRARGLHRRGAVAGAACAGSSPAAATTCTTSRARRNRRRPSRSTATGISIISTPSAAAPGLTQNRREIAKLLWRLWSPNWSSTTRRSRQRALVRQSGFRRGRDPFLSRALRLRGGRSGARRRSSSSSPRSRRSRVPTINLQGEAHRHGAAGGIRPRMRRISPGPTSAARSRASATTCRRKRRARPREAVLELVRG